MRKRTISRALTICLALTLSAGTAAFGATVFVCRTDSTVRCECCCTPGVHGGVPGGGDSIRGACCCDVVQARLPRAEVPAQVASTPVLSTVTLTEPSWPLDRGASSAPRARAVAVGIPARLQKHSLLL